MLYLLLIPTAAPVIMHGVLAVQSTPAETMAGIIDSRTLFELATVLGVAGFIVFLVLAMVLHRLFRPVCWPAADVMLAFVAVSIPLSLAAMAFRLDVLNILDAANGLPQFSAVEREVQVTLALARSNTMMQVAVIFWGLWLLPLAKLAQESGIAPRFLTLLLTIGGVYYVVSFAGNVLDAGFAQRPVVMVLSAIGGVSAMVGEIGFALWLVIKGDSRARRLADVPAQGAPGVRPWPADTTTPRK